MPNIRLFQVTSLIDGTYSKGREVRDYFEGASLADALGQSERLWQDSRLADRGYRVTLRSAVEVDPETLCPMVPHTLSIMEL